MEMSKNTDNNRNRVRHRLLPFLISSATDKRSKRSIGELKTPVKQKRWKISHSSPAVSRSLTGCFASQNIGEVAHSDGGVQKYPQQRERIRASPSPPAVSRNFTGCSHKGIQGEYPQGEGGKLSKSNILSFSILLRRDPE